jgi:hypothetical protein
MKDVCGPTDIFLSCLSRLFSAGFQITRPAKLFPFGFGFLLQFKDMGSERIEPLFD